MSLEFEGHPRRELKPGNLAPFGGSLGRRLREPSRAVCLREIPFAVPCVVQPWWAS